jgi:hypothetical protein
MVIKFKVTLADGRQFVGPIQGNGGKIGSGSLFLGSAQARRIAQNQMDAICRLSARGFRTSHYCFQPRSGHVAVYPGYSTESDGKRAAVPIKGTTFEALAREE